MIPVALSTDIAPGDIAPMRLNGQELVLWRGPDGVVHGWEDRCPHRGVRLSLGFIRDGRLACAYHGWQFDGAGQCRAIPAHPALNPPSTIRTRSFKIVEQAGLVWFGDDAREARALLTPAEGVWHPVRSLAIRAPLQEMRTALAFGEEHWRVAGDRLIAMHGPDESVTMVHLAVRDPGSRLAAYDWLQDLRDTVEETRC
ncbi:oxidoreductase [Asaia sp. W19]|uniref:Rieske 2Fe-2S domain-containing protein n=1 Tax=unclassified Asaia TaxID=2685023 RepID=UPI000F8F026A|nr:Rieske 2Fe-2S domain-containing protein [Asaia sp. W19]RUT26104.1 oxidoreductase [Asaia sp. W19]